MIDAEQKDARSSPSSVPASSSAPSSDASVPAADQPFPPGHLRIPSDLAVLSVDASSTPRPLHDSAVPPFSPLASPGPLPAPPPVYPPGSTASSRRSSITRLAQANVHVGRNISQTASPRDGEKAASILHDVVFHQLPSLCSPRVIRRTFARNLDTVVRATLGFIVAAVIAVQPWATDVLAIPYLYAMFSAGTVRPTVGSTLINIDAQGKGVLAAAVIDVIIMAAQVPALSSTSRIITVELLLFATSALLAYYFHAPLARRFSLACHGLTLILIANGNSNVYLPCQIALCFYLSYVISFVLVLVPFPRLAKDELLDRYQQALLALSAVCTAVVSSYTEVEPVAPLVLYSTAQSQLEEVNKSLTVMRRLHSEAAMESDVFQWLFPASHSLGSPVVADPDRIEELYWIMSNLLHTLHTLHYSSYHATFVSFLRGPFTAFAVAQADYLRELAADQPALVTPAVVEGHRQRLGAVMAEAWERYSEAREFVYGAQATLETDVLRTVREEERRRREGSSTHTDAYTTDGNEEGGEATGLLSSTETFVNRTTDRPHPQRPRLYRLPQRPSDTTSEVFHRSSFFFYLNRLHHALLSFEFRFYSATAAADSSTAVPLTSPTPVKRRAVVESVNAHLQRPLSLSLVGFHPLRDTLYLLRTAVEFARHPVVDVGWLKGSVKVALILCVSSLIAVIPQLQDSSVFPNALWATFSAAIVTSDNEGALWLRGIHRILGTLVGGSVGYLILLAFPSERLPAIVLLCVWCIPSLFVQCNPTYTYLGSLAQLTSVVVVFGYQLSLTPGTLTPERFAFARIEEIVVGVGVALILSSLLWPVSSIRLLRSEVMVSVASFRQGLDKTMRIHDRMVRKEVEHQHSPLSGTEPLHEAAAAPRDDRKDVVAPSTSQAAAAVDSTRAAAAAEIHEMTMDIQEEDELFRSLLSSSNSVQMSLSRQSRLLGEAWNEPVLWFTSFPADSYKQLAVTVRRIWCLVLTIEPALEHILRRQKLSRSLDPTADPLLQEELLEVAGVRTEMRLMMREADAVLDRCCRALKDGRMEGRARVGRIVRCVAGIERAFAETVNEISRRVREGRARIVSSETIVPVAVFLSSAVQLAEQVLILDATVGRLLELEQPKGYDD